MKDVFAVGGIADFAAEETAHLLVPGEELEIEGLARGVVALTGSLEKRYFLDRRHSLFDYLPMNGVRVRGDRSLTAAAEKGGKSSGGLRATNRQMKLLTLFVAAGLFGAENLQLNARLNYLSDSDDGPLLTGERLSDGPRRGQPNYVLMFSRTGYNSKRQARRTAELYRKYRGRVHFVLIDLDAERTPEQQQLVREYYLGYAPHVVVFGASGEALYDRSGEAGVEMISRILEKELSR